MTRAIDLLAQRTPRERLLLAVMVLLGFPVLIYATVFEPIATARQAATAARDDALALNAWVADRAVAVPTETAVLPERMGPIGSTGIEASLRSAGLRPSVTTLTEDNAGVINLRFDSVPFTTLARWLTQQSDHWGYDLNQFRISATDASGKVAVSLTLDPAS